ncbi:MAG: hypothetical protein EA402_06005 [Planctomycetota bacterium]|nr:MAG: hypothetical protein EA402_06005 [Planctomycetota bacterium]
MADSAAQDAAAVAWLTSASGSQLLAQYQGHDPAELALRRPPEADGQHWRWLCEQLRLRQLQRRKFGPWASLLLFTKQAAEQAASWACAHWKARHLSPQRQQVADLCAGLGMDCLARAAAGAAVTAVEHNPALVQLLAANARSLGLSLESRQDEAVAWLRGAGQEQELILCDPDRRASGRRSLAVHDWSPDPAQVMAALSPDQDALIKLAPAVDVPQLQRQLPERWGLWAISVNGELKELLLHRGSSQQYALGLAEDGSSRFQLAASGEAPVVSAQAAAAGMILADPDPACIRAGLLAWLWRDYALAPLHPQLAWACGAQRHPNFPGSWHPISACGRYQEKALRRELRQRGIERLRISRRHFPDDPPTIHRRLGIREGGSHRLFCYRDADSRPSWILSMAEEFA